MVIGFAHLAESQSSTIPGFDDTLAQITELLNRGRGIEAENVARALLDLVERKRSPDSLETAQVLDLLYRAIRASSKVSNAEKTTIVERAVRIKETILGRVHPALATSLINLGIQRIVDGDPAAAKPMLERALAIREAAFGPDHLAVAGALMPLGGLLIILHDDDGAKGLLERAQRIRESADGVDRAETVRTLVNLALLYQETGDYTGARERYERALALAEKLDRPDLPTLNVLTHAAVVLAELGGDYSGSMRLNERLLSLSELVYGPVDPRLRVPLHNLSVDLRELGNYTAAKTAAERSLSIAEQAFGPHHTEFATSLYMLATVDAALGDYSEAMRLLERATRIKEEALRPPEPEISRESWFIPALFPLSGYDADDAAVLERAAAIGSATGEGAGATQILTNLATLLTTPEEFNRTRPLFERALATELKLRGPDHPEVAAAATNLGYVLSHAGDGAGARQQYSNALRIWKGSFGPDHPKVARALLNFAGLQLQAGNYTAARPLITQALTIQEHRLGAEHPDVAATLATLAEVDAHTGATTEAFAASRRAAEIRSEHVRLTLRVLPERQATAYASSSTSGIDLLLTIASSHPAEIPQVTAAWDAVIRARGIILDEMAARNRLTGAAENPDVVALTHALTSARQRLAAAFVRGPGDAAPERYRLQLEQARKIKDSAERELAEKSPQFQEDLSSSQVGLSRIDAALPDSTALVAFVRFQRHHLEPTGPIALSRTDGEPSYLAFVKRAGEAPAVVPLGSAERIDSLIAHWRRQLEQEAMAGGHSGGLTEAAYRRAASQLRQQIWDPLRAHLINARRALIIPDGALHLVNFAALPDGTSKYLVETGPLIHYLSTERDVVSMETAPPLAGTGLLALGGVAFDEPNRTVASGETHFRGSRSLCPGFQSMQFDPLPDSLAEVNQVMLLWNRTHGASALPAAAGAEGLLLTGSAASESALKADAAGRRILHLATHGFFLGGDCVPAPGTTSAAPTGPTTRIVKENPLLLSGLILAGANKRNSAAPDQEDGVLTAEEVAALNLSGVEWVVLSGCDTGAGEVKVGEGVFGLRRAFQIAGARTVIMSLWPVEDKSTRLWMKALYDGRLMKRLGTADAVREASLGLLHQRRAQGLTTHPFYWGGFVATGDWR